MLVLSGIKKIQKLELEDLTEYNASTDEIKNKEEFNIFLCQLQVVINERDTLYINILNSSFKKINFSDTSEIEEDFSTYLMVIDEQEKIIIKIRIIKKISENTLSIYSLNTFLDNITSLGDRDRKIFEKYYYFSDIFTSFEDTQILYLEVQEKLKSFSIRTNRMMFYTIDSSRKKLQNDLLSGKGVDISSYCNILVNKPLQLLAQDFFPKEVWGEAPKKLIHILNQLTLLLSLIGISNSSIYKEDSDEIQIKIIGTKIISEDINIKNIEEDKDQHTSTQVFYDIYEWIYLESSNATEKLEIARNMIVLFITDEGVLNIQRNILSSIKSSYDIYLQKNVDRYIDVTNQVRKIINELDRDSVNITKEFGQKFSKSFTAFSAFFISNLVFKLLSNQFSWDKIITRDTTAIMIVAIIISAIYFLITLIIYIYDYFRLKSKYSDGKKFYNTLIDTKDLERIFHEDEFFKKNKKYIVWIGILVSILWLSMLGIIIYQIYKLGVFL